jgi:hypothetical protein
MSRLIGIAVFFVIRSGILARNAVACRRDKFQNVDSCGRILKEKLPVSIRGLAG